MYIQPYEPQQTAFAPPSLSDTNNAQFCSASAMPLGTDGIAGALPWNQNCSTNTEGALNDAPFGSLGMGGILTSLTGMMQQLLQMMQSLFGHGPSRPQAP
jgi:hypothetical protein